MTVPVDLPPSTGLRVVMRRAAETAPGILVRPFVFPLPPIESVDSTGTFSWTDSQTAFAGTFSRPVSKDLETYSFTTIFTDYDFDAGDRHSPNPYQVRTPLQRVTELRAIRDSGTPFLLLAGNEQRWGQGVLDVAMLATLRSVTAEERMGEPESRYVSVDFVQWRKVVTIGVGRGMSGANKGGATSPFSLPRKDAIKSLPRGRNTLAKLAAFYYGDASKWRAILLANAFLGRSWPANRTLAPHMTKAMLKKHPNITIPVEPARHLPRPPANSDTYIGLDLTEDEVLGVDPTPRPA